MLLESALCSFVLLKHVLLYLPHFYGSSPGWFSFMGRCVPFFGWKKKLNLKFGWKKELNLKEVISCPKLAPG